ncbi:MAG: hypothetical protein K8U03_05460 [Planctomycetia bacterium]|nr:hypothetical protein [Planctomycetia bacterium]
MPTLRTISTSLLLGLLLLPPHWCCALPTSTSASDSTSDSPASSHDSSRSCCAAPVSLAAKFETRFCCSMHRSIDPSDGNTSQSRGAPDNAFLDAAFLDALSPAHESSNCLGCAPKVGAVTKPSVLPLSQAWLPAIGTSLPELANAFAASGLSCGGRIAFSGNPQALLCRWNC